MTGHDLWVTAATVPMIAHYDLNHDKLTRTTSALLMLWDGQQLIDATAGFQDNESLVTELLGFRPTRRTPWARTPPSTCPPWTQTLPTLRTTKTNCPSVAWRVPRSIVFAALTGDHRKRVRGVLGIVVVPPVGSERDSVFQYL